MDTKNILPISMEILARVETPLYTVFLKSCKRMLMCKFMDSKEFSRYNISYE